MALPGGQEHPSPSHPGLRPGGEKGDGPAGPGHRHHRRGEPQRLVYQPAGGGQKAGAGDAHLRPAPLPGEPGTAAEAGQNREIRQQGRGPLGPGPDPEPRRPPLLAGDDGSGPH